MPQWLIILLTWAIVLGQILVLLTTGWIAARKGYRWIFWIFAGAGWLGLLLLPFLPAATQPGIPLSLQRQRQQWGNRLGAALTVLTYGVAFWYRFNRQ